MEILQWGMNSRNEVYSVASIHCEYYTAADVGPNCMLLPEPLYGSTPLGLFRDQQQKSARQKIIQECDNKTSNIAYKRCNLCIIILSMCRIAVAVADVIVCSKFQITAISVSKATSLPSSCNQSSRMMSSKLTL